MAVWNPAANEIFLQAAEISSPEQRDDFLEAMCEGDAELRAEVESLLCANESASGFLESPPELLRSDEFPVMCIESAGSEIGRYQLLGPMGEGGFGVVYRAEQREPVRRLVALKIIKPGMDTRQVIARFEAERQTLALMHHPHIAQVLDGGTTPSGRPYFVMELVEGAPITDFCDQNQLTVQDRLELFITVCQAVQHAHLKGIIHRDLKPSNILVALQDGKPLVKVIDFGVAKAIDPRRAHEVPLTQDIQMVGTLFYMSPEQAAIGSVDIDTRSDIYSLGVVLYELLTGVTPFEKTRLQQSTLDEVRRILHDEEPPAPSKRISALGADSASVATHRRADLRRLGQLLRGDLDWIVMQALEKDRSRRYQSAADLAADVERFQRNEPVWACSPSSTYRFRRFARRYRVPLTTGAIVLAALLTGTALSLWQAAQAMKARTAEIVARQQAENNFRQARAAVDRYFTLVSESELLDAPGVQPLRRELLSAAREYYQRFLEQRADDPQLQAEFAAGCFRLAQVENALDENDDAVAALRQGLNVVGEFRRSGADPRILRERLAGVYQGGHSLHRGTRQPTDPRQALATLREIAVLWEQFVREDPGDPRLRNDLAGVNLHIGDLLRGLRQMEEAVQPLQTAANLWNGLARDHADVAEYRANQARSQGLVSDLLRRLKRHNEARVAFQKSLELQEQLADEFPNVREYRLDLALSLNQSGKLLASDGAPEDARKAFDRARGLLDRLVKDFPGVPIYQESLAILRFELARLLRSADETQQAEVAFRDAVTGFERLTDVYPQLPRYREQLAAYARQFALFLLDQNRPAEAESMNRLALSHWQRLAADFPEELDYVRLLTRNLVLAPVPQWRDPERAVAAAERAVQLAPMSPDCLNLLGLAQYRIGKPDEAVPTLHQAVTLRGKASGFDSFCLSLAYAKLGDGMLARHWYDQGEDWLKKHSARSADLIRLRTEAAELLQIDTSHADSPKTPQPPSLPEEFEP